MRSGTLKHKVIVQQGSESKDGHAEVKHTWIPFCSTHAELKPLRGTEFFALHEKNFDADYKAVLRYIPGITQNMRIKFGERIFKFVAPPINVDEANKTWEIMCKEVF